MVTCAKLAIFGTSIGDAATFVSCFGNLAVAVTILRCRDFYITDCLRRVLANVGNRQPLGVGAMDTSDL